jgi:hypothetical protein
MDCLRFLGSSYVALVFLNASSGRVLIESFLDLFMYKGCSCCVLERLLGCLLVSVGFLVFKVVHRG